MSSETCVRQCFKCSLERIFKCVLLFCSNVHDVQMSVTPKCLWCLNVHVIQMSIMWSHLSCVTLMTCSHTCHMWSYLSHVVTLVLCGHTCHIWSHLSQLVTLVTCGHTCHMWSHLLCETNVSTADQKVSSFGDETRPTYRPAWPQVKIPIQQQFHLAYSFLLLLLPQSLPLWWHLLHY